MHILYVEDEPNEANLVERFLRAKKYDLILAASASEARQAVEGNQPDLILMDVMLGNTRDGFKLAREFRQQGFDGPMIAVTALTTAHDTEACQQAGFSDILHKPFTVEQLAEKIQRHTA
jgi:DNA-binding response OmpR family regulator